MVERKTANNSSHAVVTGGAGFLGSHLVDALLDDGYKITSLDNYGSGRPKNLSHLTNDRRFSSVDHDVRHPFPEFDTVDQVYHFASRASPADFESHAVDIAMTNSQGTRNALELAREHDARVVLASTSEVYGDPNTHPQHERYNGNVNIRGPRAPYDESKRFSEALAVAYDQQYDIDIRTVRIFNTYGPRMRPDDGRAIPNFLSQALNGDELTVYGDGSQTRSFCFVDDLVTGIRQLAEAPTNDVSNKAINLGNTKEITIEHLAEIILEIVDTDSGITYKELPQDDPQIRRPDIKNAKELLDWEPTIGLQKGLVKTAKYFQNEV